MGRVGLTTSGTQPGGGTTVGTDISPDGRFVVFTSDSPDIVPNDHNNAADVFLRDTKLGTTERVSIADNEGEGSFGGYGGLVSADGRYVAFSSDSDNLLATADNNGSTDVFLRDRQLGTTTRVSVKNAGGEANDSSYLQSMTPDARIIVFNSDADNLIGTTDQNFSTDVYIRDRGANKTQRISVATDGTEGDLDSTYGSISDDGRYVAFLSNASNFDENDSGVFQDVYLRDRTAGTTTRLSALADGTEADSDSTNVIISGDGKVVVFDTDASNLLPVSDDNGATDVYAASVATGAIERISSRPDGGDASDFSFVAGVSDDGRYVFFQSGAKDLVGNSLLAATDGFVRDRTAGRTVLAATTQKMTEPLGPSADLSGSSPNAISGDGRYLLFSSTATDVMADGDTNSTISDVYLESNPVPLVLGVTPNSLARGTSGNVVLSGINLRGSGALVIFGDDVTVNSVNALSETQVSVSVTVAADAVPGPRTPMIVQTGTGGPPLSGGLAYLPNAFTVT
ncbi:MAG: TolB family protein [Acidimicrobiia bacterium]